MKKQKFKILKLFILSVIILFLLPKEYGRTNMYKSLSGDKKNGDSVLIKSGQSLYSLVKITAKDIEKIKSLNQGFIFNHRFYRSDNAYELILDEHEIEFLKEKGIEFTVLIENVSDYYVERNKQFTEEYLNTFLDTLQHFEYGSMGGFYTFDEAIVELDSMKFFYPDIITVKESIGSTHFDNPVWMVKISDNPEINEEEPEILYTALHHANEPQGLMCLMYYMWYLLENYGIDEEVTYLVDNCEMYFIPVLNVDGYLYNEQTHPNGGGMWRKNARDNGNGTYGVDLNRNYDYMWGYDNIGSSPETNSDFYRGPSPFSEPESQAVRDFILDNEIKINLNFHTFGNILVQPFAFNGSHSPDVEIYENYGANVYAQNKYNYGTCLFAMGALANGSCEDWMYGEQDVKDKVFGFAVEVGNPYDSFWPPMDRIFPLARENVETCLFASKYSSVFINLKNHFVSGNDFLLADTTNDLVVVLKNYGLSDGTYNFSVALSCNDAQISISNDSLVFPAINSQQEIDNFSNPFQVYIPQGIPNGYYISFKVKIYQNGLNVMEKSFPLIVGKTLEESAPAEWIDIALDQILGWDYQCALETRFEGYGKFLEVIEGEDELIYRYFLTGKFYIEDYNPGPFEYLYRLWAFLDMNSNGEIPTQPYPPLPFPNPSPYESFIPFHILEGHDDEFPVHSGSLWYDGGYTVTEPPVQLFSVHAIGDVLEYFGVAYEGFEIEDKEYYLTEGTLYDVIGDSLKGPREIMGTLKYDGAYHLNLESGIWEDYLHNFLGEYYDDMMFSEIEITTVGISPQNEVFNEAILLYSNFPNPFNFQTTISYQLPAKALVTLNIYNISGQEIRTLVNENQAPGKHSVVWDGTNNSNHAVEPGVYFYKMECGDKFIGFKKMILMK